MVAKKDSLLAHCLARAVIHEQGGLEAAAAKYGPKAERLSKWRATATAVKVTPKASRVAGFVVLWATAMRVEDLDSFSITEYQRYWNESERQAYRRQVEFRELWPEYETPNELAGQIVAYLRKRGEAKEGKSTTELMTVPVLA
jgi:hypothetical protein